MKKIIYLILGVLFFVSCSSDMDMEGDYSESDNGNGQNQIEPGQITAGEWNDLDNWDFWNNLFQNQDYSNMPDYWSFNLNNRISVNVKNQNSENLQYINVKLVNNSREILWEGKTDNFGNAELWPFQKNGQTIQISDLKIQINDQVFENLISYTEGINNLVLNIDQQNNEKKLDLVFIVDATGSMGDELEYLKVELVDIIDRVKTENANITINLGSIFYRDEGDDYVTRKSEFSEDIQKTVDFINNQAAGGGGDFPEAVHTALNIGINDLQWSTNSSTKIIFLILDAPPHYETQIISELHSLIYTASQKGIKVIPVTASGIDKQTEFLMRYFSIATTGTYVFITNDSGIGNEHLEPSVGDYEVEFLNDLIVRLINKYI